MIAKISKISNNVLGSSLNFSAHEWWGKEKIVSAEKSFCRSEDGSAGGGWGEFRRARAEAKLRRLLVESRTPKKSFGFLLEENIRRAQIKKREQNFSLVWRALASGGGAERVSFAQNRFGLCRIIAPSRKSQRVLVRLASLGDQIVWIFRGKKKFPIPLEAEKKNFNH